MLCYSTGSLPDHFSFPQIISTLKPTPFRGLELVITPAHLQHAHDTAYWVTLRQEFAHHGLCFRNIHLGYPLLLSESPHAPGLGSLDKSGRDIKAQAALSAARIATWLEAPHITFTTGLPEGNESSQALQINYLEEFLRDFIQVKYEDFELNLSPNLKILIEQEPEHIIRSTDQLIDLCKIFPGEVYANFDIGHAAVMGENIPLCLQDISHAMVNLHLEDIVGQVHTHKLYGQGNIDFDSAFGALRNIGYSGDFTPDLYPFKDDYAHAIQASQDFLEKYLGPLN